MQTETSQGGPARVDCEGAGAPGHLQANNLLWVSSEGQALWDLVLFASSLQPCRNLALFPEAVLHS